MAASRPVGPRPTVRQALRTGRGFRRVEGAWGEGRIDRSNSTFPSSGAYVIVLSCSLFQAVSSAFRDGNEGGCDKKRPGLSPRPSALLLEGVSLGVLDPYLAVDLLDEGVAVLVLLLELANLIEILDGKTFDPLGDLIDRQLVVVGGPQGAEDRTP